MIIVEKTWNTVLESVCDLVIFSDCTYGYDLRCLTKVHPKWRPRTVEMVWQTKAGWTIQQAMRFKKCLQLAVGTLRGEFCHVWQYSKSFYKGSKVSKSLK